MPLIELETLIRAPREECFDLSLSVDAHMSSMGRSGERAIAGVTSGVMRFGDTVTWRGRHFGVPFRLTSRITAYERPLRFVDEQISGPFAIWHHEHRFGEAAPNVTRMVDRIEYRSPAGPLGVLVDRLFLERYMRALIERRNAHLKSTLEALPR
jgi:ligand-binding SRPBCC domain-containing protein